MASGHRCCWLRLPVLGLLLAGCAGTGPRLDEALLADHNPAAHGGDLDKFYQVHCPDVLEIHVSGEWDWNGRRAVGPDGRIDLAPKGPVRVDGLTTREIVYVLAGHFNVRPAQMQVRVADYNSQKVYLCGEVVGLQRALAYQGPETVVDLLQRSGGITPGAAPREVFVVRSHVADGKPPEVFHVDLPAIVVKQDQSSNLRLQPFDQVYIGQSRQSVLCNCLPPWSRPLYEKLCGMKRS
jgi:protein involved in polysaccharide export with SLBB domain